jgi:hypothetical protein
MNSEMEEHLAPVVAVRRPPPARLPREISGFECPKGLHALLEFSDGLVTRDRLFRVFGVTHHEHIPTLEEWNAAEWKAGYGALARDLLFIAEDIFGDQYGYSFRGERQFIKFHCEGGGIEPLDGINWFIESLAAPVETGAIDGDLLAAAFAQGIRPEAHEHLAFRMPLIVGGGHDISNVVAEPAHLHLGMLAQLSLRNASLPDGTPIAKFTTLDGR